MSKIKFNYTAAVFLWFKSHCCQYVKMDSDWGTTCKVFWSTHGLIRIQQLSKTMLYPHPTLLLLGWVVFHHRLKFCQCARLYPKWPKKLTKTNNIHNSSVTIATKLEAGRPKSHDSIPRGNSRFFSSSVSWLALELIQYHIQCVSGVHFLDKMVRTWS